MRKIDHPHPILRASATRMGLIDLSLKGEEK